MVLDISVKKFFNIFLILLSLQISAISVFAAELKCAVCGMPISDHAKNHILMNGNDKAPMHVCSLSCVKKTLKHDSNYTKVEVADFNDPEKMISADAAFFLIKSENIKSDLGDKVMGPYFGAFSSQAEATAAQKKYGDGSVIQGIQNAIK